MDLGPTMTGQTKSRSTKPPPAKAVPTKSGPPVLMRHYSTKPQAVVVIAQKSAKEPLSTMVLRVLPVSEVKPTATKAAVVVEANDGIADGAN